jgi:hypothetical protein
MPRIKKERKPPELRVPDPNPNIDNWLVLGLDPSVSRTGFALLGLFPNKALGGDGSGVITAWLGVGSVKPDKIEDYRHTRTTLWARSKAIALFIREYLKLFMKDAKPEETRRTGLLISMEYPTPQNDYLVGLNRILHVVLFEDEVLANAFGDIRVLTPNASTLRSLMGLKQRGVTNKKENIEKAYTFVDQKAYPQLDSDSCDAVLMAMMGRYVATILMGRPNEVPNNFLVRLCNATVTTKISKKGRVKEKIEGILLRAEYWYAYERQSYGIGVKDATNPKKTLTHKYFMI